VTVSKELSKYKLDLGGVHYFFYRKGNETHELCIGSTVHKKIVSAAKMVQFVSNRRWCHIIVPNVSEILKKEWEYNETGHWLFIYFKKAWDMNETS
jgi:hypothetical protein